MKNILFASALAAVAITAPAAAQSAAAVGVADVQGAVQRSAAFVTATTQMRTTYAAQIAQFDARSKVLQTELNPLVTAFQTAQRAPNANQAALQTQATTIQNRQQAAQRELQTISLPIARAQAFVEEQITAKLDAAIKAAMTARGVQLVVAPQATVSYAPTVDITDAIVAELNKTVPTATIVPPANWQPGGQGGAAPAATPAAPGR